MADAQTNELLELAARCEQAAGTDRELDTEILRQAYRWAGADVPNDFQFEDPTEYTASLDAAMTLVPEGMIWSLYSDGTAGVGPEDGIDMPIADVDAATPTLALCAAALRARASKEQP